MSSLLCRLISSNLSKDEIILIDKQVKKNRKELYLFLKELPLNSKRKAKRLECHIVFMFAISQSLIPCAASIMIPLPQAINRLSSLERKTIRSNQNYSPQTALTIKSKIDKMVLTDQQIQDFNLICYKL